LTEVFLNLTDVFLTLTEVFPCFFLSCKANTRVKLAKTGHGPHSSTLVCICVVRLLFVLFYVLVVCKCVLPPGDNPTAVNNNNNNNNNNTNYFKNKILKKEIESKCRLCKQHEETIDHLTSGRPILAKNEYLMRHDKVCTHLHYSICKALGIKTANGTHTCPNQCMKREMSQCCGIKQYTQTEKLQQIGQI